MSVLLALAIVGCSGGRSYRAAPEIALPPGAALGIDAPREAAPPQLDPRASIQRAEPLLPPDAPPEIAQGTGPRGTSGEAHEDVVGYAALMQASPAGPWNGVTIGVAHPTLPVGTLVELTALDTGRTIVAMVVSREDGAIVALSPGAAQALGVGDHAAVRVRSVVASPQDQNALRSGKAAGQRLDAPPALLVALRRRLPGERAGARPAAQRRPKSVTVSAPPSNLGPEDIPGGFADQAMPRPAVSRQRPVSVARPRAGFVVQVAALSSPDRAQALAQQLGGRVAQFGRLYRVELGPYATASEAQRARDGAARRGYGDARISHTD
jgi:rare lipoprotein A